MPDPHETSGTPVDFDLARPLPKELPRAESSTGASSGPSGEPRPRIGIVFGSATDWPTMSLAVAMVDSFGVPCEYGVVSAHRTPDRLRDYARGARARGLQVIIAGAGGAAHLPGMIAAWTTLPVLGVPIRSRALHGVDSLLSIVQMPKGVPVGTLAIGDAGARNAALLALRMLGAFDDALAKRLEDKAALDARAALAAPLEGRLDP